MASMEQSQKDNFFALAAKGKLPASFNHWLIRNEVGDTIAHVYAKVKKLPATFKSWGVKNKAGVTVAQVAYDNKTLPAGFLRMELVKKEAEKPVKKTASKAKK